jgi:hypothetical protein
MKMVKDGVVRATANLNLRSGPGASHPRLATIQRDVLAQVLADPAGGWVKVQVDGWARASKPNVVHCEPDERASVEATRAADDWQAVSLVGFVSTGYLVVVDGPK